jgi:hypothetical protein
LGILSFFERGTRSEAGATLALLMALELAGVFVGFFTLPDAGLGLVVFEEIGLCAIVLVFRTGVVFFSVFMLDKRLATLFIK